MKRIQLISGPRNISTAMMYAFGNRLDTHVIDEPFYGHYLSNNNIDHPGKAEIIKSMHCNMIDVLEQDLFAYYPEDILFIKNMAHHYINVDYSVLSLFQNVFLIRDLKKLIYSFSKVIPNPSLHDIGIKMEHELFMYLKGIGLKPIVIDADEFLKNPHLQMLTICNQLNIPFSESLLNWKAGPRKEDGIWAKYWYANVHKSTVFQRFPSEEIILSDELLELYEAALPYYNALYLEALKLD